MKILKIDVDFANQMSKNLDLKFDFARLCEKISVLRNTNMLDQQMMADYLGYSRAAYSNNECNRKSSFDLNKLLKIKTLFGLTWSELLGESEVASEDVENFLKIKSLEAKLREKDLAIEDLNKRLIDKERIITLLEKTV